MRTATFLFAAGQETTARLLAAALKHLAEHPELQDELRGDRDRIPDFLEEVLRVESPVKTDFRLARRATTVGGVDIAAGTPVMLLNGAANRDPRRFECPAEFRIDRANAQAHIAFGRGVHSCPGGPLARAEGRVSLERILDRMHDIRLSEEHHGPPGDRRFDYEPTWVLRGLDRAAPRVHAGTRVLLGTVRVRSSRLRTLPDGLRGSASMNTTSFGTLNFASCVAAVLDELVGGRRRVRRAATTNATGTSPHRSSGRPTTATSTHRRRARTAHARPRSWRCSRRRTRSCP